MSLHYNYLLLLLQKIEIDYKLQLDIYGIVSQQARTHSTVVSRLWGTTFFVLRKEYCPKKDKKGDKIMQRKLKSAISIVLAIALLLCASPLSGLTGIILPNIIPAANAAVVESGTCGENLTWSLDNNGTLTISGTGEMGNYEYHSPWESYQSHITTIVISEGVTSLGERAFWGLTNVREVYIADRLVTPSEITMVVICDV